MWSNKVSLGLVVDPHCNTKAIRMMNSMTIVVISIINIIGKKQLLLGLYLKLQHLAPI